MKDDKESIGWEIRWDGKGKKYKMLISVHMELLEVWEVGIYNIKITANIIRLSDY